MKLSEEEKREIIRKILSYEARERLARIRLAKPEFAEKVEALLIQLFISGKIKEQLSDEKFKDLLKKILGS
ncbi:MAG: DNA-binding protein [Candidatus Aenigmatarchaeota archaeon]